MGENGVYVLHFFELCAKPDIHLPDLMTKALENQGILCNWIAGDYHSKRSYDVTTQSVTISTIHSVKGFDYAWNSGDALFN